jgi:hypothetical protein
LEVAEQGLFGGGASELQPQFAEVVVANDGAIVERPHVRMRGTQDELRDRVVHGGYGLARRVQ